MMTPATAPPPPVLTATHAGGLRFDAEIRGHRIATDQPIHGGGDDGEAMPLELIGASLATCIALYVYQYLHHRDLPTEGLRVEVSTEMAEKPKRIGAFDVRVVLPDDLPSGYLERLEHVAASCPAHNTLMHPPEIRLSIDQSIAAGGG